MAFSVFPLAPLWDNVPLMNTLVKTKLSSPELPSNCHLPGASCPLRGQSPSSVCLPHPRQDSHSKHPWVHLAPAIPYGLNGALPGSPGDILTSRTPEQDCLKAGDNEVTGVAPIQWDRGPYEKGGSGGPAQGVDHVRTRRGMASPRPGERPREDPALPTPGFRLQPPGRGDCV